MLKHTYVGCQTEPLTNRQRSAANRTQKTLIARIYLVVFYFQVANSAQYSICYDFAQQKEGAVQVGPMAITGFNLTILQTERYGFSLQTL